MKKEREEEARENIKGGETKCSDKRRREERN
jgi:hypothetical protein